MARWGGVLRGAKWRTGYAPLAQDALIGCSESRCQVIARDQEAGAKGPCSRAARCLGPTPSPSQPQIPPAPQQIATSTRNHRIEAVNVGISIDEEKIEIGCGEPGAV